MFDEGVDVIEREPHLVADANASQLVGFDQSVDRVRGQSQVFRERFAVKELPVDARLGGSANERRPGEIRRATLDPHRWLLGLLHE
jgi:hypothetical protein